MERVSKTWSKNSFLRKASNQNVSLKKNQQPLKANNLRLSRNKLIVRFLFRSASPQAEVLGEQNVQVNLGINQSHIAAGAAANECAGIALGVMTL